MAKKICPKCSKGNGPRTKICECGHVFIGNSKKPIISKDKKSKDVISKDKLSKLSMGAWIYDTNKNMPKVSMPPGLESEEKFLDNDTIRRYAEYEGFGYTILTYISPDRIEDIKLQRLWILAKQSMIEVIKYLYE